MLKKNLWEFQFYGVLLMKRKIAAGITLLVCTLCFSIAAERIVLQRVSGPVELDGMINEPAWEGIEPLPMTEHSPRFGNEPSERTELLIAYDDDFLYVAGRLYDREPLKIMTSSRSRDTMNPSNEWFGVLIDSFNDKENALGFFTTPAGLRWDAEIYNDAQGEFPLNLSWNTFWDVATSRNDEGWFAELRIPFSSLRFQDREGHVVMGILSWRSISRKNEMVIFPAVPPKWGFWRIFKPSQTQEVVFEGVFSRNPLYVAPYVLGGFGQLFELNELETDYIREDSPKYEAGLDLKYSLTSNITLDITLNPDFAQVEADDQQVNLTRFSLFFPEKRLFFQERSSIFNFDFGEYNRLFYSRRIGLYEERMVRIYGGTRIVGRLGSWDLGFLNMQTAEIQDVPSDVDPLSSENFGVLRVRRQVFNPYSYVGCMVTSRIGTNGTYNLAYGLDGIFRVFGDDYLTVRWAQTFEDGARNALFSLEPARLRLNWQRRKQTGFGYDLGFSRAGLDYDPGIGFEMREDFTRLGNSVFYGWIEREESWLFRHRIFLNGFLFLRNADGAVESAEIGPAWEFESKSGYTGNLALRILHEGVDEVIEFDDNGDVPVGEYTFFGLKGKVTTPWGRRLYGEMEVDAGSFYDGWRISAGINPLWSISPDFGLIGLYQYNRIWFPGRDQQFTAHIGRLRFLATLSTKLSASAFIQYNGASNVVIANLRFRYNPHEGNDLYIVYNEVINTDRYREIPSLPYRESRAFMVKYTYTFDF